MAPLLPLEKNKDHTVCTTFAREAKAAPARYNEEEEEMTNLYAGM
ncbi:hypothetical protein M23134_04771 [Microscilla marina ATCC 23134]|uniref:Uncharacterized protein n=1 Tax=Microscilla marina ATCC 23134 TaxID=313606 RepID=A1ZRJ2_MICM2|nr:hypothetical protein M23134_04771 [Microscilla marina ATCC 23134]